MRSHAPSPLDTCFHHRDVGLVRKQRQLILCRIVDQQHVAHRYFLPYVHRDILYQCVPQFHGLHTACGHVAGIFGVVAPPAVADYADRVDAYFFIFVQMAHQKKRCRQSHNDRRHYDNDTDCFFLHCHSIVSAQAPRAIVIVYAR